MSPVGIAPLRLLFLALFLNLVLSPHAGAEVLDTSEVTVVYSGKNPVLAERVANIYPAIRRELAHSLSLEFSGKPTIVLSQDRNAFSVAAGGTIFVAYAVPQRNLIVLDVSSTGARPDMLASTLKHEVCHLVLHDALAYPHPPRWLEEGVCQWASSGISELLSPPGGRRLAQATLSGAVVSLREIETFPSDEAGVVLAYEQSKSFVEFIVNRYGSDLIPCILLSMREGNPVESAVQRCVSIDFAELERAWRLSLTKRYSWFFFVSNNLPLILFVFGGLVTAYGFLRFLIKKRAYRDEDEEKQEERPRPDNLL